MGAFKIVKNGKILDYRRSEVLDLDKIRRDFSKKFEVVDVRQPGRHIIITIGKNGREYIIKLATTEGIGARSETEKIWNDEFNKYSKSLDFRVPNNLGDGNYCGLYYLIIEKFDGPHLSTLRGGNNTVSKLIDKIIDFSELIQNLPLNIPNNDLIEEKNPQKWFVEKTNSWREAIPNNVVEKYNIDTLFGSVKNGAAKLSEKVRHGDFTPWHMIALSNGGIGLIDGEHAHSHGVEGYDIAYLIQRVFAVIDRRDQAEDIFKKIKNRKGDIEKLKTVLKSRAIGGFCDEYLAPVPNYEKAKEFADWVQKL